MLRTCGRLLDVQLLPSYFVGKRDFEYTIAFKTTPHVMMMVSQTCRGAGEEQNTSTDFDMIGKLWLQVLFAQRKSWKKEWKKNHRPQVNARGGRYESELEPSSSNQGTPNKQCKLKSIESELFTVE